MTFSVFSFVKNSNQSLMVEAVAGSGKTTTIVALTKLLPKNERLLFCAFNKSITMELNERLPLHVECMTLNALGHRAWRQHIGSQVTVSLSTVSLSKSYDILRSIEIQREFNIKWSEKFGSIIPKLISAAKINSIVPYKSDDDNEKWYRLFDYFDIDIKIDRSDYGTHTKYVEGVKAKRIRAINIARTVLALSNTNHTTIDFNDQLYLPIINNIKFPQYHTILVDEFQDISPIQTLMIQRSIIDKGRFIGVGDRHQSIYGFRGASVSAIQDGIKMFDAESLPLNYSYRCAASIVEEARKYSTNIIPKPDAPEGIIKHYGEYTDAFLETEIQPNDMVLCRNVAPLIQLAFRLINFNHIIYIVGSSIATNMITAINKFDVKTCTQLIPKLDTWRLEESKRRLDDDPDADISAIDELYLSINSCIKSLPDFARVDDLIDTINRLFTKTKKDAITLSTVHKAKGSESDRVFILDQQLIPSKYAKKPWQKQQERNIMYVAITRAKSFLAYIETPEEL